MYDARLPQKLELPATIDEDPSTGSRRKTVFKRRDDGRIQKAEYEYDETAPDGENPWRIVGGCVLDAVEIEVGEPQPPATGP